MRKLVLIAFTCLLAVVTTAQNPIPAKLAGKVLIKNGIAHIGNGQVIQKSIILIENEKIVLVDDVANIGGIDEANFDLVIDATGKHIYPGIIAPNSKLGLVEVDAVRATEDYDDVGTFNPHVRAVIAYNTDSRITPTVRTNGVLIGQITPRGGRISGSSSIVGFDGWNWEDAVIKIDDGIHLNWPKTHKRSGWWAEPGPSKKNDKLKEQRQAIFKFFEKAKAYAKLDNHKVKNIRLESMRGMFRGSKRLYIHTSKVKDITRAVLFAKEMGIYHVVIVGGYEAYKVADFLKENKVAVMLKRVHSLPSRRGEDIDLPYRMAGILQKAGVTFCLQNAGDMDAMNSRNIPFLAGTTVAYGLTKEQALTAITLSSAKIMGIDAKVGSLESGKLATLFISKGDCLDVLTNDVEVAFISGRNISLDNHQKQLYKKFKAKYAN